MMTATSNPLRPSAPAHQRGMALPVMLIILAVMLFGSVYMMKASNTSTLVTSNLAYEATQSRAADLGLLRATNWLNDISKGNNRALLNADNPTEGYVATYNPALPVSDPSFWSGSITITDTATPANKIEYVIHRMCRSVGSYDEAGPPPNSCMVTTPNLSLSGGGTPAGESLAMDAADVGAPPRVHYVVTARIFGARGGNVVNQSVVMIGA